MKFSCYLPDSSTNTPFIIFLSGLTCNEDNFIQKAAALRKASELGIALICPDTSPRGISIPGDSDHWSFGVAASFYVDATVEKWKPYQMQSYITEELFGLVTKELPLDPSRVSICGHSMVVEFN